MNPNPENPENVTEATAQCWTIPADIMPRKVEVKKSTVELLVAGKPGNGETKILEKQGAEHGCKNVDLPHADHSPYSKATR